jgi:type I restriction-modification system DNA methylase subunit
LNAPTSILQLVDRFDEQRPAYLAGKYNETQLRSDFLNPLFEALGWDVLNHKGRSEKYREVILEQSVEVAGQAKAADYAFRVGEKPLFFVEAKKPAVNIGANPEPAFQVRRYGWSAKLSLSILSDFEQLAVYDCRIKPVHGDLASVGRVKLYSFKEYPDKWQEISDIFSCEAVLKGSFDQFAEGLKGKRGTADVDDAFLEEMERWRGDLARSIALRNPELTQRDVNSAVQTTIDRMIFLRICEERGIEAEDTLRNAAEGKSVYERLVYLFKQADKKYNSGLFHFSDEKKQSSYPDSLTLGLKIDDKVLKDILAHLYYPLSPYAFNYIPTDILGQVYERFLGKVIRLTAGHQAKVEEKPEVRKAGGVYYTPTYIVEYIVKHTLGELLKEQSAESQKAQPLRVLDPACGSGSFLLGAYQYLLDWYLDWYIHNDPVSWAKGKAPAVVESKGGWQLTMDKKKEILLNHIYGVDIDAQAVEVTKLSLLLKVVENPGQLSWLSERILPDLGENIQCGNSLIGPDYYDGRQMPVFGDDESYRVNVFDWHNAFPQVFAGGGFDAVIGNPPYIRIQALQEWASTEVEFYKKRYKAASKGNYDIYVVFVEKALSLLNKTGRLGYILPSKFFATDYGECLRKIIAENQALCRIVDFGHLQVFDQATTYTCLLFLAGFPQKTFEYTKVDKPSALLDASFREIENNLSDHPWTFSDETSKTLLEKITSNSKPLSDLPSRIGRGSSSGCDGVFILRKSSNSYITKNGESINIEPGILRIPIFATNFGRYEFHSTDKEVIIFPYRVESDGYKLISEADLKQTYPNAYKYLASRKKELEERKQYKEWYSFSAPRNLDVHEVAQILVPLLANRGLYCRLSESSSQFCLMASGGFSITVGADCDLSPNYVLGLLNSNLLFWRLRSISNVFRGGWITCTKQYVETLPIRKINFSVPIDAARHARMVALVEGMLTLHKHAAAARLPQDKEMIQRQIQATDAQIDRLVYELYGLTEDEIKIVEGG